MAADQVTAHLLDPRVTASTRRTAEEERRSTCVRVIHFLLFLNGAMASSAVSSVLYLRGNHVETRIGAYIYYGDAASFHAWKFALDDASVNGLRADAFVTAQEVGFDNLCETVDGRPGGIDTLLQHMREMVFPLTEHES